ncbi:MAG: class I SAM-dependent methyltransferase [Woeseiaceae bacterium]|nr:class I SAM-dependent methyltransferase [Woeseiaceae bacterium]
MDEKKTTEEFVGESSTARNGDPVESRKTSHALTARLFPWTTFCEGIADIEAGYTYYPRLYKRNFGPYLPEQKNAKILVVSAGPGYFVDYLNQSGYMEVLGIDSDPEKVELAGKRSLNVIVADAMEYLTEKTESYDMIILEQEINHLTKHEFLHVLALVKSRLAAGGSVALNAGNYANPITAPDHFGTNIDHYSAWTSLSLDQAFKASGYAEWATYPLDNYVLYGNPLNYIAKALTGLISIMLRITFKMYGKDEKIFSKRLVSIAKI